MPTNRTPNYSLSQWELTDKIQMSDFNADNEKIDAALAGHAGRLARLGNCQLWTTTYTGDGTDFSPTSPLAFTFPHKPVMVLIMATPGKPFTLLVQSLNGGYVYGLENMYYHLNVEWEGNTLRVTGGISTYKSLNAENFVYHVVALLAKDQ